MIRFILAAAVAAMLANGAVAKDYKPKDPAAVQLKDACDAENDSNKKALDQWSKGGGKGSPKDFGHSHKNCVAWNDYINQ